MPGTLCTSLAAGSYRNLSQTTLVAPDQHDAGNITAQMNVPARESA
jgi:hypothetical protein